jgi:methylglutaconyl-CoA hydratase
MTADAGGPAVNIERRDGVGELTLARPDRRNALDYAAVTAVVAGLRALDDDDAVGAVLLAGDGPSFCAGGDLAEFRRGLTTSAYDFHTTGAAWAELMTVIPAMRKPVVAAVHGHALAGGCGLVAAADVVLAADDAQFGTSEIRIGLFPIIVYPTLARAVGGRAARELALTGRRIGAAEALRLGLVHRVVEPSALLYEARRTAAELAALGSHALGLGKWFLRQVDELPLDRATALAQTVRGAFMTTPDFAEGLAAFAERRPPRFRRDPEAEAVGADDRDR